jgi:phosphoribosylanthranilate isomerase
VVKVKICGITNLEDAQAAVKAGCDALGFIFYKKSPRYISPRKACQVIAQLPAQVATIGVFVNSRQKTVKRIAGFCRLSMLQFHGNESPAFCRRFKGYKIIKTIKVKDKIDVQKLLRYDVFAFLFDTWAQDQMGGTGRQFDWSLLKHLSGIKAPLFLSGGLSQKNVKRAVRLYRPDWVDVSSSLERRPGKKDHGRMKKFVQAAKED